MEDIIFSRNNEFGHFKNFRCKHGFTTQTFGNCGYASQLVGVFREINQNVRITLHSRATCFFKIKAQHGDTIRQVAANGKFGNYVECDGLICTDVNGSRPVLISNTADCPAVLLTTWPQRTIALVHSGREGTKLNIAGKAVTMLLHHNIKPNEIYAAIWPGICPYCYPLKRSHLAPIRRYIPEKEQAPSLAKIIYFQLVEAGIDDRHISFPDQSKICSAHSLVPGGDWLFASHSRSHNERHHSPGNGFRNSVFLSI